MNLIKYTAWAGHLLLMMLVFMPGSYPSVVSTSQFDDISELGTGYYNPLTDTVSVGVEQNSEEYDEIRFHEEVHHSQYNALPLSSSPIFLAVLLSVLGAFGGVFMQFAAYDRQWRKYLGYALLFIGIPSLLEIHAYAATFLRFDAAHQLAGLLNYLILVGFVFVVTGLIAWADSVEPDNN